MDIVDELLIKAKDGDIEAFSKLITLIEKDLERVARTKLKDKNYVNDVLQNVYYKAYMKLHTLKENEKFKSWIFMILKYECIDLNKSLARKTEVSLDNFGDILEDYSNYDPEANISFEQMISNLSESDKRLIRLKFQDNLTNREISEELGIPYNTVRSRINRALKKITLILLILILFSGFTVLAVYIVKQIRAYFTTSLNSIDAAVENEYVQEIDSDFIYDSGIGIKADAIILDDKNLAVSFMYDVLDKEKHGNITGIQINECVIKAKDEILFDSKNNFNNLIKNLKQYPYKFDKENDYYRNSVIFSSYNIFPELKSFYINIQSIIINSNDKTYVIEGNWDLKYDIWKIFNNSKIYTYGLTQNNEFIKTSSAILTDTSIEFNIDFNIELDNSEIQNIILYNNENIFKWTKSNFSNNNHLKIVFDLGKYNDNIEELNLEIPRYGKENIVLKFRREP